MLNCMYDFLSFYPDNSDVEDGSLRKRRRSSSSPSSDPKRNKGTAGNNVQFLSTLLQENACLRVLLSSKEQINFNICRNILCS